MLGDFRQQEYLLGSQLGGLNRDAAWLKSYAAATLVVAKETMQVGQWGGGRGGALLHTRAAFAGRLQA